MGDSNSNYTKICSAKTIQSDDKGFFNEFFQEVRESCGGKWLKNRFGKLKTDQERMLSIFNDPEVCDPVLGVLEHVKSVYKQKDATFSTERRMQGEKAYLLEEYSKALAFLNLAVVRAPAKGVDPLIDNGLTAALAYWTRSAVLLALKDGRRALGDLKLAVASGLNIKHNAEYYIRTARAYAYMNEGAKSKIALTIAEKLYEQDTSKFNEIKEEITNIVPIIEESHKPTAPPLAGGENPSIKNASALVDIIESPDKGRYVVAKVNTKTGDTVLVEKPVAACLLQSYYGSHCHHCFEKLVSPVGCPNCSGLAFCSEKCMMDAVNSYHKFECQFQHLFLGSGMSILCYVALRILTQANNVEEGLANAQSLVSSLCTHSQQRGAEDFLQRALMSAFLLRCLQKADYFGKRKTEAVNPTGLELQTGAALLGLLQLLQFNAHEIYETVLTKEHKFDGSKPVYIGAGIYRTGSYFNHDCCPGVARYFVGRTLVLVCTRPSTAGHAISENYGPICTKIGLKERQNSLKSRYWFACSCTACLENWPSLQKLDKNVRFRCTTTSCEGILNFPKDIGKDVRCTKCRKNISLKGSIVTVIKVEEMYRLAAKAMKEQNTEEAINIFKEGIDLFHEVAVLPHKDTLVAQESLRVCFADTGTKFTVVK